MNGEFEVCMSGWWWSDLCGSGGGVFEVCVSGWFVSGNE